MNNIRNIVKLHKILRHKLVDRKATIPFYCTNYFFSLLSSVSIKILQLVLFEIFEIIFFSFTVVFHLFMFFFYLQCLPIETAIQSFAKYCDWIKMCLNEKALFDCIKSKKRRNVLFFKLRFCFRYWSLMPLI